MRGLVHQAQELRGENESLRGQLDDRERRIRTLDEKLLESNQLRQDAIKRIDDLLSQLDQIDAHLETAFKSEAT